jgi:hypothetical protein
MLVNHISPMIMMTARIVPNTIAKACDSVSLMKLILKDTTPVFLPQDDVNLFFF